MEQMQATTSHSLLLLMDMRERGQLCDVTLQLDSGHEFKAHRSVLAIASPFFQTLFTGSLADNRANQKIRLPQISLQLMKLIICYCYSRIVSFVREQSVEALIAISDRLMIFGLKDACCKFLEQQLSVYNCVGIWKFSRFYNCHSLEKQCRRFILRNFSSVSDQSDEWLELDIEDVESFCSDEMLNSREEEHVYRAINNWLTHSSSRSKNDNWVGRLFHCLRIELVSSRFLRDVVSANKLVRSNKQTMNKINNLNQAKKHSQFSNEAIKVKNARVPHQILITIGGWTGRNPNDSVEIYDVRTNQWHFYESALACGPRAYHSCVVLNRQIFIIGGYNGFEYFNSVRRWDVEKGKWHEVAPMNCRRCYVTSVSVEDKIYVFGGFDGISRLNSAEVFNPSTNQWSLTNPMATQRSDAGCAEAGSSIYVCGGFNGRECLDSVEKYDVTKKSWSTVASMNTRRSGVSAINYNGSIYVLGGFDGRGRVSTVERYNESENVWRFVSPMKVPRSNFSVAVIDDLLYVVGGYNGGQTIPNVECYNKQTNQWTEVANLNRNRSALSLAVVSDLENMKELLRRN